MTLYAFDTGPLLCFAGVNGGPTLLKNRYHNRAFVLTDVDADLRGLTKNPNMKVAKAAQTALTAYGWIERRVVDDEDVLARAEDIRDIIDTFKRRPRTGDRRPREDWTEAVTLAYVETLDDRVIVINEDPGRMAGNALDIQAICTVDILRAMVADATLTAPQAYKLYQGMMPDLDAGEVVKSAAELKP